MDFKLQSTLFGFRKPTRVTSLSTDDTLTKGTKIIGETLVFVITASIVLYISVQSQIKDNDIERDLRSQKKEINQINEDIYLHEQKIEQIRRDIYYYIENKSHIPRDVNIYKR